MKWIRNHLLTTSLLLLTFVYHAIHLSQGSKDALREEWFSSQFTLRWLGRTYEIPLFRGYFTERPHALDAAFAKIAGLGYAARFLTHQTPQFFTRVSRDGRLHLVLREDSALDDPEAPEELHRKIGVPLLKFTKAMSALGVEAVILPIPPKFPTAGSRNAYRKVVESDPAHVVDLWVAYENHRHSFPDDELYVPLATHWSSLGMNLAVTASVEKLRDRGWKLSQGVRSVTGRRTDPSHYDLLRAFQLPEWFTALYPPLHWTEVLYQTESLAVPSSRRVFVAGSCFSTRLQESREGFPSLLSKALGRVLHDSSVADATPFLALQRMHARKWILAPGDLLVIEFPLRIPADSVSLPTLLVEAE